MRFVIGVVLASIVLFGWGFVYWGFFQFQDFTLQRTENTETIGYILKDHFPQNGTYIVPGHDQLDREQRYLEGPVAMIHMLRIEGRPEFEKSIMIKGFALNVIVVILMGVVLQCVAKALPTYWSRVGMAGLIGLTAAVMIDLGEIAWWEIDWKWQGYAAVYHVTAALAIGLVLGAFIRPPRIVDQESSQNDNSA